MPLCWICLEALCFESACNDPLAGVHQCQWWWLSGQWTKFHFYKSDGTEPFALSATGGFRISFKLRSLSTILWVGQAFLRKAGIRRQGLKEFEGRVWRKAGIWRRGLLLSHFSRVWLCATPEMTAHQVPPSLGFSRQEHWSGLPFPSPMHESENESEVAQSGPTLSNPMDCSLPGPSSMGFSRQEYWSGVPLPSPLILYAPLFLVTSSIMPSFSLLKSHLSRPSSIIIPSL